LVFHCVNGFESNETAINRGGRNKWQGDSLQELIRPYSGPERCLIAELLHWVNKRTV
jgi:hypothetical protein